MNLQHESYLLEQRRWEQLADIDRRWQVVELVRFQGKRPFLHQLRTGLQLLWQIRRIRIQVSLELHTPCPDAVL